MNTTNDLIKTETGMFLSVERYNELIQCETECNKFKTLGLSIPDARYWIKARNQCCVALVDAHGRLKGAVTWTIQPYDFEKLKEFADVIWEHDHEPGYRDFTHDRNLRVIWHRKTGS